MRVLLATVVAALAAAGFAAWTLAAPTKGSGSAGSIATDAKAAKLPALPAAIKRRGRFLVGVKCDNPPFGYSDLRGRNAGYDVDIARAFARFAFGSSTRVTFECVTTASRITALQAGRIDLAVATITYFPERLELIDYSTPYFAATGRLLIRKGTSLSLRTMAGKTIATTPGSIYSRWLPKCFPQTERLFLTGNSANIQAVKDGRADAFMFDDAFLLDYVIRDPDMRVTRDKFLRIPWGIGIKKGNRALKRWVDSRLAILRKRDEFRKILFKHAAPQLRDDFAAYVPRPKRALKYPAGRTTDDVLPCP